METRMIGSLAVSVVGLGCNNFGWFVGREESAAVVGAALDAGISFFDTADVYGGTQSETYLGAALGGRRDEVVLATKFGMSYEGREGGASAAYVRTAVEDSLTRLGTDRIDLYQLHLPDPKTPIAETLGVLSELVAEGKIREYGCSNFTAAMLEEAAAAIPESSSGFVSVQNEYNVLDRGPELDGVLDECTRSGTAFLPFYPLAKGLLSGKYRSGQPLPEGTRLTSSRRASADLSEARLAQVAALDDLARGQGHTVVELAIAWLLTRPAVASVIAGATKPEQVTANVPGGAWRLGEDVLAEVDAVVGAGSASPST